MRPALDEKGVLLDENDVIDESFPNRVVKTKTVVYNGGSGNGVSVTAVATIAFLIFLFFWPVGRTTEPVEVTLASPVFPPPAVASPRPMPPSPTPATPPLPPLLPGAQLSYSIELKTSYQVDDAAFTADGSVISSIVNVVTNATSLSTEDVIVKSAQARRLQEASNTSAVVECNASTPVLSIEVELKSATTQVKEAALEALRKLADLTNADSLKAHKCGDAFVESVTPVISYAASPPHMPPHLPSPSSPAQHPPPSPTSPPPQSPPPLPRSPPPTSPSPKFPPTVPVGFPQSPPPPPASPPPRSPPPTSPPPRSPPARPPPSTPPPASPPPTSPPPHAPPARPPPSTPPPASPPPTRPPPAAPPPYTPPPASPPPSAPPSTPPPSTPPHPPSYPPLQPIMSSDFTGPSQCAVQLTELECRLNAENFGRTFTTNSISGIPYGCSYIPVSVGQSTFWNTDNGSTTTCAQFASTMNGACICGIPVPSLPPSPPAPNTCSERYGRINTQSLGSGKWCYDMKTTAENGCNGYYSQTPNGNTRLCYNPSEIVDPNIYCSQYDVLSCLPMPLPPPVPPSLPPAPPTASCDQAYGRTNTQLLASPGFCYDLNPNSLPNGATSCDDFFSHVPNGNYRSCYADGSSTCKQTDAIVCPHPIAPAPPPAAGLASSSPLIFTEATRRRLGELMQDE